MAELFNSIRYINQEAENQLLTLVSILEVHPEGAVRLPQALRALDEQKTINARITVLRSRLLLESPLYSHNKATIEEMHNLMSEKYEGLPEYVADYTVDNIKRNSKYADMKPAYDVLISWDKRTIGYLDELKKIADVSTKLLKTIPELSESYINLANLVWKIKNEREKSWLDRLAEAAEDAGQKLDTLLANVTKIAVYAAIGLGGIVGVALLKPWEWFRGGSDF